MIGVTASILAFGYVLDLLAEGITAAYIDPGSGGMLFQMLAVIFALFSGVVFFFSRQIKVGLTRIKRVINEKFER